MQTRAGTDTSIATAEQGLRGLTRAARVRSVIWLAFAAFLLVRFYPAAWRLARAGQDPLALIRADAGGTRLELAFWAGYAVVVAAIAFGLPARWFRKSRTAALALLWLLTRGLPYAGQSWMRAGAGLLGAGLVLLAVWGLGALLLRPFRALWQDPAECALFELLLGCGGLAYLFLALSLAGAYTSTPVRWVTAALAGVGGVLAAVRLRSWSRSRPPETAPETAPVPLPGSERSERLWLALLAAAGLVALVGALAPETGFDALWYHLWLPRLWLEQGRPIDRVADYISLYPLTWELLYGAALNLGGAVAAKLVSFAGLPVLAALVHRLARRLAPAASPWLSAALVITAPTMLWEATTAYNDLPLTLFAALTLYSLVRFLDTRAPGWLLLAGLSLGLALAVKHLALFVLLLACLGLFLALLRRERRLWPAARPAALLAAVSLAVPLPWYVRSALASGNPFFPELYSVFGAFPAERWSRITEDGLAAFKAHFGFPLTPLNLLLLPWNVTIHAERFGGTLGVLFLLLIPGLLFARRRPAAVPALPALAGGYLLLWVSPWSSLQMRFLLPLVPVLAVLAAVGFSYLRGGLETGLGRRAGSLLSAAVALIMLLNLPPFILLQESGRQGWTGWLTHVTRAVPVRVVLGAESEQEFISQRVFSYPAWQYINSHLPANALVLSFAEGDNYYSQRDRIPGDSTLAHPAAWGAAPGESQPARDALNRLGITHILYTRALLEEPARAPMAITQPDFLRACLSLEYEDPRYQLFRLTCR